MDQIKYNGSIRTILTAIMTVFGLILTVVFLVCLLFTSAEAADNTALHADDQYIMDAFDTYVLDVMGKAEAAALSVPKTFVIEEGAEVPTPDIEGYGTTDDPSSLQWLLDQAEGLLDGQETLFRTDIEIREGSVITYYYDQTILAISWQQVIDNMIYTIAEVKIADASQFRRYMADGYFGSKNLYTTTQMSAQAGAVLACSGDYFRARDPGIVVYDGIVERYYGSKNLDTCFVDRDGNLILVPKATFTSKSETQQFVDDNDISFSFAFGPILVDNGVQSEPKHYGLGEVNDGFPRAAICQKDELHYLMVVTNGSRSYRNYPNIHEFAGQIAKFNVQKAYSLDGGQTGAIVMQDELLNPTEYDGQRRISDMFFFATALPE